MKLYTSPGSCSSASHIALIEGGIGFEAVIVDLRGDRTLADGRQFKDINPKNYVPVLELDNGELLTENVAVLQYIADQAPDSGLAPPAGTLARYRLEEWLGFINSEVHKTIGNFFNPDLPAEMRPYVTGKLDDRFGYIDAQLDGKAYLMGDTFTVADAYLYIVSTWAPMVNYDLSGFTNVLAWQERVGNRPSIQAAKKAA